MINDLKESLWKQFGASIDMLKNAIILWPEEYWNTKRKFFYNAYHCLIFLDYYLTIPPKNFTSPLPFTIAEPDKVIVDAVDDLIPDRVYSKKELLDYLQSSREKCHQVIAGLTEETLKDRWIEVEESGAMNYSVLEILLYNMRHVQHHAAQLNLLLRQGINDAPGWVARAEDE
ncbi:MAG TPA: DinB family protein [Puia sp.]|nr:DinB family protein [Puia sp.]